MPEFPVLHTHQAEETHAFGKLLASYLQAGAILGLEGPLGSGKTALIQGICAGLNVKETVASPTFVLMHIYHGKFPVYHFDLYRLELKDLEDLGWEDYLQGNGISVVEWIDRAGKPFPYPHLRIALDYGELPDSRRITFQFCGIQDSRLSEFLASAPHAIRAPLGLSQ